MNNTRSISLTQLIMPVIVVLVFTACSSSKKAAFLNNIRQSTCNQENSYHYSKEAIPAPLSELKPDSVLTAHFTFNELHIANAIGVLDLLKDFVRKRNEVNLDKNLQNRLELLELKQELNERIDLASLEISSVTAELDCEEERLNQIASYISEKEAKKETNLTIASIILGSLSAIATADLVSVQDESSASDLIGVGVGVADAAFGVILLTSKPKVRLSHPRNVLREIWFATETSSVYPPSIWYYLNYKNPEKANISLREQLIQNWEKFGQIQSAKTKESEKNIEIYFSEGGEYSLDELSNRADMYDQIESLIKLMKQDLRKLSLSISKLHSK